MEQCKLSKALMKRLPLYLNHLKSLPGEDCNISATAIAHALGLGEVQVRKDLAKICGEGRRRTGRSRDRLIRDIEAQLESTANAASIIVGDGILGEALLDYSGFDSSGVNVMACFHLNPTKQCAENGKPIYPINRLEAFCRHYDVRIGIIAVPPEHAQSICDCMVACGIRAIWNFAPVHLTVPEHIVVQNENLATALTSLHLQLRSEEILQ